MEGSRRWRALKLWFSWKHLGTDGLGRLVAANIDLAAYLARRIAASPDFEASASASLSSPSSASGTCPAEPAGAARLDPATLDAHQDRLAHELEASGDGWVGTTRLGGATYLRAGIVNYLATEADVDRILDDLRAIASGRVGPVRDR